jgi:glycosyltransferase involved in cell wall biosynthesis
MTAFSVSCIVPVYNGERFLAAAVESILGQTRPPLEVIVVDDGSTDRTPEIARSFRPPVRVIRQANAGPVVARNRGVAESRGDFIAFLDADDLWHPEKLARQLERFERRPELAYVAALVQNFWEDEVAGERERMSAHARAAPIPGYVTGAMVIRRTWMEQIGPFDMALGHADSADWVQRANEAGAQSELVEEVLLRRRLHANNRSRAMESRSREEFLQILKSRLERRRDGAKREP